MYAVGGNRVEVPTSVLTPLEIAAGFPLSKGLQQGGPIPSGGSEEQLVDGGQQLCNPPTTMVNSAR